MKKIFLRIFLLIIVIGAIVSYWGYMQVFSVNTVNVEDQSIYISTGSSYDDLLTEFSNKEILKNDASFKRVAEWMNFKNIKPGRYIIKPGLNNRQLVSLLRSGDQTPINLTISSARTIEDIVEVVHSKIEADSLELISAFQDKDLQNQMGYSKEDIISIVIPNTYEFFWNTSGEDFIKRMIAESDKFWKSENRDSKKDHLGMTRRDVITLASIVEKESIQIVERPRIAGVYLNRLEKNMLLQADPTVVFGIGDFSIRRVLYKHLEYNSPYNTYKYQGLPPGPICMPSISSIDAVLDAENHDYLFFCAKPGYNGEHLFATSSREHERNARRYRRWLNSEGIKS